jgi:hypothetical protein
MDLLPPLECGLSKRSWRSPVAEAQHALWAATSVTAASHRPCQRCHRSATWSGLCGGVGFFDDLGVGGRVGAGSVDGTVGVPGSGVRPRASVLVLQPHLVIFFV